MDFNHVLVYFFTCTAIGAASVLAVILLAGLGIRRSSTVTVRRTHR